MILALEAIVEVMTCFLERFPFCHLSGEFEQFQQNICMLPRSWTVGATWKRKLIATEYQCLVAEAKTP